ALRAIRAVRPIEEIRLISRSGASAERLAAELRVSGPAGRGDMETRRSREKEARGNGQATKHDGTDSVPASGARVVVAGSPAEAVRGADVVVTATTSGTPVFAASDVGPGVHVNAVGAFRPTDRELESDLVARARVVVDTREGCLAEAGDLLIPIAAGQLDPADVSELGEVGLGRRPGRTSADQITLYKSVGHAALDVAMAGEAIRQAEALGLGQEISLS